MKINYKEDGKISRLPKLFEQGHCSREGVHQTNIFKICHTEKKMKAHHHINLDSEFKEDCKTWKLFLEELSEVTISRPFVNWDDKFTPTRLRFFTDASAKSTNGLGCVFQPAWSYYQWEAGFIQKYEPSIEFLELYALCLRIFMWAERLCNKSIVIHCYNQAVISMVNNMTSSCRFCMTLIRKLVLLCMRINLRIQVQYVRSKKNILSDSLSRMDFEKFNNRVKELGWKMDEHPTIAPPELWPLERYWKNNCIDLM